MNKNENDGIRERIYESSNYDEKIKQQIWIQINSRLDEEEDEEMNYRKQRKWKILLVSAVALIGGTVFAAPVIDTLQEYFGQTKSCDFYNTEKKKWVNEKAQIYMSELGYTTFFHEDYFELIKEDHREQFIAKTGKENGKVQIERIQGKSLDEVLKMIKDEYGESVKKGLYSPNGIIDIYNNMDQKVNTFKEISLCDAKELGVFKITIEYDKAQSEKARDLCFYIKNQFTYLDQVHSKTITQGKGVIKFEYDKTQYELIRDTGMPENIMLVKKGSDLSKIGDIVLSYQHFVDDAKKCMMIERENINKLIEHHLAYLEEIEDEEEQKEEKEWIEETLPVFEQEENDLNISAIKVKTGTKNSIEYNYYINDGKGGCYNIWICDIQAEGIKNLLQSIELIDGDTEVMEVIDRQLNAMG